MTDKPGISETLNDLKPIAEAYSKLQMVDAEPSKNTKSTNSEGAILIGGNKKIEITEDNFNLLKARIAQVRQQLTDNK